MVIESRTQLLQLSPRKVARMQQSCRADTCAGDWPEIGLDPSHCCLLLIQPYKPAYGLLPSYIFRPNCWSHSVVEIDCRVSGEYSSNSFNHYGIDAAAQEVAA